MLFRQNTIEFINLKETHIRRNNPFRVEIWDKTEELKNFLRSLGPRKLNQILAGTDCRHVLRTFNGMLHVITYIGPLRKKVRSCS